MRMMKRNKQKMWYSLQLEDFPIYQTDEDGNIEYMEIDGELVPIETGETKTAYSTPVEFRANISLSGGYSEAVEFGLDLAQYAAVLVCDKGLLPIDETSRIWHTTEPIINADGTANEFSADYTVVKVSPSLNVDKYVLQKVTKGEQS